MIDYKNTLHIVYGSRTGNAKAVAMLAEGYAKSLGFNVVCADMPGFNGADLAQLENVMICVSTHGEGEPPVQAEVFYEYVTEQATAIKANYAVLGLGDSSYRYYCQTGKDLDRQLEQLGGTRMLEVGTADIDFEDASKEWVRAAVDAFSAHLKPVQSPADHFVFELDLEDGTRNAYRATLLEKRMLIGPDSSKKVLHVSLGLKNSGISYLPGDAIGVFGANSRLYVDELLAELGFDKAHGVESAGVTRLLKEVLINDYELTLLTPLVMKKYAAVVKHPELDHLLADKAASQAYADVHDVLDLVRDYKGALSIEDFLSVLRKLSQRLYSAASSQRDQEEVVDITVKVIENAGKGRIRNGVCSSFLWHRLEVGDKVPVSLEAIDKFRLPEDSTLPIIMIGAGTGIAPFRGFLQERKGTRGANWLIFGERNKSSDFLYQQELEEFQANGTLHKLSTAFSRDQQEKIYVSDVMGKESEELLRWLDRGALIYVCGSKDRLAKSVRKRLVQLFKEQGLSADEAKARFEALKAAKRYQEEVY